MKKVSVILPSIRPQLIDGIIERVRDNAGVDVEIVLVSPYWSKLCDVWVQEPDDRCVVAATNAGVSVARGQWLTLMCDEAIPQKDFVKNMLDGADKEALNSFKVTPPNAFSYWGIRFAPFPFFYDQTLEDLHNYIDCDDGALFSSNYKNFYADPHLGLYAHSKGFKFNEVDSAVIELPNITDEVKRIRVDADLLRDRETFIKRWEPVHGPFQGDC